MKYHFVGVGGSGMSAIAQVLIGQGHAVSGSDRSFDRNLTPHIFNKLKAQGISLFPQDGSGVTPETDFVIVSTAIEESNPDIHAARKFNIPIKKRAEELAEIVNERRGVAIGGSSGKTTTTAMTAWLLETAGLDPTVINGGFIKNYISNTLLGNAKAGGGEFVCVEADESDGSIVNYTPEIAVITNISKDHKTVDELIELFRTFANNTTGTLILNADCPVLRSAGIEHRRIVTFGTSADANIRASDIALREDGSEFVADGAAFRLKLPGAYNISNALGAIAVGKVLGLSNTVIAEGLETFLGVSRRMDFVGEARGIKVIDDFAHNPAKIEAALKTLQPHFDRIIAVYQPHGFGPTKFLRNELVEAFSATLRNRDVLHMLKIYYAGGTADMSISSEELVEEIKQRGKKAVYHTDREELADIIAAEAQAGDVVIVMGARDNTLPGFCAKILERISRTSGGTAPERQG